DRDIEIKYFADKFLVIGDRDAIIPDILLRVQLQYFMIQYGRTMTDLDMKKLVCDIYNSNIYPYSPNMKIMRDDIEQLVHLNNVDYSPLADYSDDGYVSEPDILSSSSGVYSPRSL